MHALKMRCSATELNTSGGEVLLVLRVDPGEAVHETTKGDVYLRVGDESRRLGYAQRRELDYDPDFLGWPKSERSTRLVDASLSYSIARLYSRSLQYPRDADSSSGSGAPSGSGAGLGA